MSNNTIEKDLLLIANNQQKVYNEGYNKGQEEATGTMEEFSANYCTSTSTDTRDFRYKFAGYGWNDKTVGMMNCDLSSIKFSNALNMFTYSRVTELDYDFDFSEATQWGFVFSNAQRLKKIKSVKFNNEASHTSSPFSACKALEDITIAGEIGVAMSFADSPKLTKSSLTSIVNALSTTTSDLTITLPKTAITNAFGGTTSEEWLELIADKDTTTGGNWKFTYK